MPTGCIACNGNHFLYQCSKFLQMNAASRSQLVSQEKLCKNCLRKGHYASNCSLRGCKKCLEKHNTLLHYGDIQPYCATSNANTKSFQRPAQSNSAASSIQKPAEPTSALTTTANHTKEKFIILGTARVKLLNNIGTEIECRALLDSGSQINLISDRAVKRLGLTSSSTNMLIQGIGQGQRKSQKRVNVILSSTRNAFSTRLEAFVLSNIIPPQPSKKLDISSWSIPHNIQLADPAFHDPDHIDVLLGTELFFQLLSIGQINLGVNLPTLQNTVFGWIVAGGVEQPAPKLATCGMCSGEEEDINITISRFWDIEQPEEVKVKGLTIGDQRCETYFEQTCKRDSHGRFVVSLPFSDDPKTLGQSKDIAFRRFLSNERRLMRQPKLRQQYTDFMEEYQKLGHMQEVSSSSIPSSNCFLPHHCVLKPDSSPTKLRVVFDASAKTTTNISLNNILHTGPVLQEELFTILLRFRLPRFVFTADIEKMYRQINVNDKDRNYQLIWWRSDQGQQLRCYQLNTVTYGTSAAPYLAIKCLQRLAQDEGAKYPLGADALQHNFYVDDVMTGADSMITARDMQSQLVSLLSTAGFKLRKWCANHPQLLSGIAPEDQEVQLNFSDEKDSSIKTLGLIWLPKSDYFCLKINIPKIDKITKRTVASDIARLFDPLGLFAPVIVTAKIYLQELWGLKQDWDASLPLELHTRWTRFRNSLLSLEGIQVPRHVFGNNIPQSCQLHAFADASEKAYGAAIYIRSTDAHGKIIVRLLCSKSRVSPPPPKKITLPRLELCAAELAAKLLDRVKRCLRIDNKPTYLWTDSEIVLAWINSTSADFQVFVGNRIASIHKFSIPQQWRHVRSKENPADPLSRGISPEKVSTFNLWFYGPPFLHGNEAIWPHPYSKNTECNLERKRSAATAITEKGIRTGSFINTIHHRNSFKRLQHIMAYMLRFLKTRQKTNYQTLDLQAAELGNAQYRIVKIMQNEGFEEDLTYLKRFHEVPRNSSLAGLTPFIDQLGIIRVGGRLEASNLPYASKHPMLLPYGHPGTKMILTELHLNNRHVGPQALLGIARQTYWPIKGKIIARSVVQHCVFCARTRPKIFNQLMGNLPSPRVQPARPFVNSGVDFCGPVWTHFKIRGKRPQKSYIAVFCCFSTKAIHLELVTDLTTEGFIGALKRFTARRGNCRNLYCDNGTNFIGARNQLHEVKEIMESQYAINKVTRACSSKGTDFHLIPPRAPHFGGLWEAAVKSAKHLLRSTLESASLTYEEMETVVTEVEAILNSRPTTPMSTDPNDLMALTPGHFLIGEPLNSLVDSHAEPLNINCAKRWKLVTHLKNEFWRRWHLEYLNQLQFRSRWKQRVQNIKLGTMVIIREENIPALRWKLGRIIKAYPGDDGLIRVVDVRTSNGILRRPIHKLAPLPIEDTEMIPETSPEEMPQDQNGSESSTVQPGRESISNTKDNSLNISQPKKKMKVSLGSTLVTLFISCLMMTSTKAAPIETTPFDNQPGIFFENLGPSGIISSEWTLVVYYNMDLYWKEVQLLKNYYERLADICKLLYHNNECQQIINQFQHLIYELTQNNELLKNEKNGRFKRGAANIIGNVANALFGILDSEYADYMEDTIRRVEQNELHLSDLLKNQTSLIDATLNIMRKDQKTISNQFHQLEDHINRITLDANKAHKALYQAQLSQLFISVAIQSMLLATNFYRIQTAILDVMMDTQHGKMSTQLLPPSQLIEEINQIQSNLSPSLKLPYTADNILELYSLMHIQGRSRENYIIFKITIPILAAENLELFHVIPVPVKVNNTFIAIQPSFPYLLVNLFRDQYYPLTEQELSSCTSIKEERTICKQQRPMYRNGSLISACEINFMNQAKQSPSCRIARVEGGTHWIQLHAPNQWVYSLDERTTLNVVCGENVTQFSLHKSGLLKMQSGCVIKQHLFTIQAHNLLSSERRISYTPATNITEALVTNLTMSTMHLAPHYQTHLDELDNIKSKLLQMKNELPATLNHHDVHHYSFSLLIIIVIICYLAWKIWRSTTKKSRNSVKSTRYSSSHKTAHQITMPKDLAQDDQLTDADFMVAIDSNSS